MTTQDSGFKKTLAGIRNLGLEASTRTKMFRIAREYTMGKKRKKLMVFLIAVIGFSGLSYGLYQGLAGGKRSQPSIAQTKTDFKVPTWMGGTGKPKNVTLGKSVAVGNYKAVSKHKNKSSKKTVAKGKAKKGKSYAKTSKGKKTKYTAAKKSRSANKAKLTKKSPSKGKKSVVAKSKAKKSGKKKSAQVARR